jgi:hypothetical protein
MTGDSSRNGTESCPVAGFGISSARDSKIELVKIGCDFVKCNWFLVVCFGASGIYHLDCYQTGN